ncbi:MAG: hypothetical protein AMK71_01595 [Nitrospira bacterium SG8_35_4]|nr:MAG: hypothetical protein AMK71_01595 [Nitrospira bacterium SG8_35_4]
MSAGSKGGKRSLKNSVPLVECLQFCCIAVRSGQFDINADFIEHLLLCYRGTVPFEPYPYVHMLAEDGIHLIKVALELEVGNYIGLVIFPCAEENLPFTLQRPQYCYHVKRLCNKPADA